MIIHHACHPHAHAVNSASNRRSALRHAGFTLIESLMACSILLVIVVAVTSAVTAGQHHAFYAHQRIGGTLAAEEWMGRLEVLDYDSLITMHEVEPVGTMLDINGQAFPETFNSVGREAWVTPTHVAFELNGRKTQLNGITIRVRSFDAEDRTLADISRFIPEPAVKTLSEEDAEEYVGEGGGGNDGLIGKLLKGLFGW